MYAITAIVACTIAFFVYQYWKYKASDNGAPYVAIEHPVVEHILQLAQIEPDDVLYDLGSGDGRVPIAAALNYNIKAVGIEIDRFRHWYALYQRFILRLGNRVTFINKNIFNVNLSEATICFVYLTQQANEGLEDKFLKELGEGTLIISPSFQFPGWTPVYVDENPTLHTPWGPTYFYEIGTSNPKVAEQTAVATPPVQPEVEQARQAPNLTPPTQPNP
ncbi:MAG TPA: hypothetical protein VLE47_00495 [Candidatus Saccharimonadales bacterium]|nr:hypothetical protein [Candidatus Saccharimonadales bacterium]